MSGEAELPRVLVLHNRYRSQGGEERAAAELAALLRDRGHTVKLLERHSEQLTRVSGRLRAGAAMLRGGLAPGEVSDAVREIGADVVHAHNTVPLLGPRALAAARAAGARVVMHLHNYRLVCAIGIAYRDGAPCTRCQGRNTWPGARLRCRGNVPEALTYAAGISLQQRRVLDAVDRFVLTSQGSERVLAELGLPLTDYDVIPNFLPDSAFAERSTADSGGYALYAGRLAEEKGVDTAIDAAKRAGVPLAIAGEGPDEPRLRRLAGEADADVRFLGQLDAAALAAAREGAAVAVVPSRWHEPHPYAVCESMAAGLPVLVSRIGGLPEIAGDDSTVPPGDAEAWENALRDLWSDPKLRRKRGEAALNRARERFAADGYYERLMACYRAALA
ncbi:MAG: glycosyltransferase family 4 protein [Actinomycetota bacterium]